ncbi:MAG: serine hydrolase [Bacilli bacterium]
MAKTQKKKKLRLKKRVVFFLFLIIALFISFKTYEYYKNHQEEIDKKIAKFNKEKENEKIKKLQQEDYEKCMKLPYQSDTLETEFNNLFDKYKNDGISIYFTDINNEYSFNLNPTKAYFSASVIKLLDVIYYVEKVRSGEYTGNETIKYIIEDKRTYSTYTAKYNLGDEIPIKNLIEAVLLVSDNTAHEMMARYFGTSNLNLYFKNNYNLNLHLTPKNPYESNFTAILGNDILKILYDLLQVDDEFTELIKKSMDNDDVNSLNFDDKRFLHKYGEVIPYHNQLGIYDSDNPYLITILTTKASSNYMETIPALHREIYNLYSKNLVNKNTYCDVLSKEKHQLSS